MIQQNKPRIFYDDFGNRATITNKMLLPYNGAQTREQAYILTCYSDYDGGEIYYLSIFETPADAIAKLKTFSCGTFTEAQK